VQSGELSSFDRTLTAPVRRGLSVMP